MRTYDHDQLTAMYLAEWSEDDFAVFRYPPKWRQRYDVANDTTRLILDFKENVTEAVDVVTHWAIHAYRANDAEFRKRHCRYVVTAPRSGAGVPNAGAERLATALVTEFPYLQHLPNALVRTESVPASHRGERPPTERHIETIAYRGPKLPTPDLSRYVCSECSKEFRGATGLGWHYEHTHSLPASTRSATAQYSTFLLIDDIITNGRTSAAARTILHSSTSVPNTVGFFVGRTQR
jgi:hypothetical protein